MTTTEIPQRELQAFDRLWRALGGTTLRAEQIAVVMNYAQIIEPGHIDVLAEIVTDVATPPPPCPSWCRMNDRHSYENTDATGGDLRFHESAMVNLGEVGIARVSEERRGRGATDVTYDGEPDRSGRVNINVGDDSRSVDIPTARRIAREILDLADAIDGDNRDAS